MCSPALTSSNLAPVVRVTICTIQRLYSIPRGEELDEDLGEKLPGRLEELNTILAA